LLHHGLSPPALDASSHAPIAQPEQHQQPEPQQIAAAELLRRLLPDHHHLFCLAHQVPTPTAPQWFSVEVSKGLVHISGTSGVELASGVHWFLKYFAGASVSWEATGGLQLSHASLSAAALAGMEAKGQAKVERAVPFSFYQNVVTMSYSMAFWDWDRWGPQQ
jgi:alpha-N-acetylglucosaminidase